MPVSADRPHWLTRSDDVDTRIAELVEGVGTDRLCVVAVGGYGRRELSPASDVDVVLVHDGSLDADTLTKAAESIWYPLWDDGLRLGHAVRTVPEALRLADDDLATATALLSARPVAGAVELGSKLAESGRSRWSRRARRNLSNLARTVRERHERYGEVANLLEPDVKEGRGGLRDVHAIAWAQAARPVMLAGDDDALRDSYDVLLGVRHALHEVTGRRGDRLGLADQDAVAEAMGLQDADELVRRMADAARTVAWRSDEVWERVEASLAGPVGRLARRDRPCGPGVVLRDGQVHAQVGTGPDDVLDVAVAAARRGVRIERGTLVRLAAERGSGDFAWTPARRDRFVELLASGPQLIQVVESLQQYGLWTWVLPEWERLVSLPQRNAYHSYTVDRHLVETVVGAAERTSRVRRPDLLVLGALLHDIGKGLPGDHSEVGVSIAGDITGRMGFDDQDLEVIEVLVRHHLLLPDVATRRDIDDDSTVDAVASVVPDIETLELLHALTEADSLATGPAAWSDWKSGLVARLVGRVAERMGAPGPPRSPAFPTAAQLDLATAGELAILVEETALTVVAPDRRGLFSTVAGGLALAGLDVLAAQVHTEGAMAIERFEVRSRHASEIDPERTVQQLRKVLDGRVALAARLAERSRSARRDEPARVAVDQGASERATVVEVLAPDSVGLLHRLTRAIADLGLDVRSAHVQTLADRAVDTFYVTGPDGTKVTDAEHIAELERAVLHAVEA